MKSEIYSKKSKEAINRLLRILINDFMRHQTSFLVSLFKLKRFINLRV